MSISTFRLTLVLRFTLVLRLTLTLVLRLVLALALRFAPPRLAPEMLPLELLRTCWLAPPPRPPPPPPRPPPRCASAASAATKISIALKAALIPSICKGFIISIPLACCIGLQRPEHDRVGARGRNEGIGFGPRR